MEILIDHAVGCMIFEQSLNQNLSRSRLFTKSVCLPGFSFEASLDTSLGGRTFDISKISNSTSLK